MRRELARAAWHREVAQLQRALDAMKATVVEDDAGGCSRECLQEAVDAIMALPPQHRMRHKAALDVFRGMLAEGDE